MVKCVPLRDMDLHERIRALKEYDVPQPVIDRILCELTEYIESEKMMYRDKDKLIGTLYDTISYKDEAINALGAHIKTLKAQYREA
jgi:hypothetical protein